VILEKGCPKPADYYVPRFLDLASGSQSVAHNALWGLPKGLPAVAPYLIRDVSGLHDFLHFLFLSPVRRFSNLLDYRFSSAYLSEPPVLCLAGFGSHNSVKISWPLLPTICEILLTGLPLQPCCRDIQSPQPQTHDAWSLFRNSDCGCKRTFLIIVSQAYRRFLDMPSGFLTVVRVPCF
jgi:hypothetical protein